MKRNIIKIDEDKCNGCGICVSACHEGAIALVDGKAKLMREDYCDGLGNCLPACPTEAITMEEREADSFNEEAVKIHMEQNKPQAHVHAGGCPGTRSREIERKPEQVKEVTSFEPVSELRQWPVQIKLVPVNAPYFDNANLLIAADCTAFANANFHHFMKNKITIIGCPKLDEGDYTEKLTAIIKNNAIKSVTVIRMEVPCCGGIVNATTSALQNSGKMIPWSVITIGTDGTVME